MSTTDRWVDDVTARHIEGRFIDLEVVDALATGDSHHCPRHLAVELRCRSLQGGPRATTVERVKSHNREGMIARFPKAWEHYEANKAGKSVETEKTTPLSTEALSVRKIAHLAMNGFGTVERFLAMSDMDAMAILGERGIDIREAYRAHHLNHKGSGLQAPKSTSLEVKGPIDPLTLEILQGRAVVLYEEVAAWSDDAAWAYLGPKGKEVRDFARRELVTRANPSVNPVLAAHGLDTPQKVGNAAAMIDKAVRKAGAGEKKSKSRRA